TITTRAWKGGYGYSGDGGPVPNAQLKQPSGVSVDGAGNLFIADISNHRIRRVSPDGIITTIAGTGARGFSGDGGPATDAQLLYPTSVAVDNAGNVYVSSSSSNIVRIL